MAQDHFPRPTVHHTGARPNEHQSAAPLSYLAQSLPNFLTWSKLTDAGLVQLPPLVEHAHLLDVILLTRCARKDSPSRKLE